MILIRCYQLFQLCLPSHQLFGALYFICLQIKVSNQKYSYVITKMSQRVEQFSLLISLVDMKHLIKAKKKLYSLKISTSNFTKRNYFNIEPHK